MPDFLLLASDVCSHDRFELALFPALVPQILGLNADLKFSGALFHLLTSSIFHSSSFLASLAPLESSVSTPQVPPLVCAKYRAIPGLFFA